MAATMAAARDGGDTELSAAVVLASISEKEDKKAPKSWESGEGWGWEEDAWQPCGRKRDARAVEEEEEEERRRGDRDKRLLFGADFVEKN